MKDVVPETGDGAIGSIDVIARDEKYPDSAHSEGEVASNKDLMLHTRGVRKVYQTGKISVEALVDVNFDVKRGELVAVMGPSGSGKTTLLNCLSGIDDIDSGEVWVEGVDIQALSDRARTVHRARSMGFVFQAFNLIPIFSALENVALPLLLANMSVKEANERAEAMLDRVGLSHRLGNKPSEMSGGEQQRTTIARALVGKPAIVWADEPTGNLDTQTAQAVLDLLWELNDQGQTLVLVTHDPTIGNAAGRIVHMLDGEITSDVVGRKEPVKLAQ